MKYIFIFLLFLFNYGFSQDLTITRQPRANQVVCWGESSFTLDVSVSGGGDLGYTYIWEHSTSADGPFAFYVESPSNYMRPPANTPGITDFYRVVITDVESGLSITSGVSSVIVNNVQEAYVETKDSGSIASGVVELFGFGGQPPYKYTLLEINPIPQDISIFSNLSPGFYTARVVDALGCYLELLVSVGEVVIDNSLVLEGNTLTTNIEAIDYKWIDVDTESVIDGATERFFTADRVGRYRVEMTVDVNALSKSKSTKNYERPPELINISSPVYEIGVLDLNDSTLPSLNLYPNPVVDLLMFPEESLINKSYTIYDILGHKVDSGKILGKLLTVDKLSKGMYFFNVEGYKMFKFLKK